MRASLAKFCWRAVLAIASPLAGTCFALRLFEATPQDPVGAAWIAAAVLAFSLILGIGFSIDALETRGAATMAGYHDASRQWRGRCRLSRRGAVRLTTHGQHGALAETIFLGIGGDRVGSRLTPASSRTGVAERPI